VPIPETFSGFANNAFEKVYIRSDCGAKQCANMHRAVQFRERLDNRGKVNRVDYCAGRAHMKSTGRVCSPARAGFFGLALIAALGFGAARAQNEPILVPEAVDYQKLLPILPEPPSSWSADKPEGSTEDVGGFKITNVHRDYHKGEGEKAPTAAISVLDSVSNPDYVSATTEAWKSNSDTSEGYAKSVNIEGNPGFETFEKDSKHAALWVMIANRYFVQIELQNEEPSELQEWIKRVDLKKLAAIK
jgi:hypothetical protein